MRKFLCHEVRQRYLRQNIQSKKCESQRENNQWTVIKITNKHQQNKTKQNKTKTTLLLLKKTEFSISVSHRFLLLYWNLMTDLDFYLIPTTGSAYFSVTKTHFIALGFCLQSTPLSLFPGNFFPHPFQACLLWEISKTLF